MNSKLEEFKSLLKSQRRPKSTENIFFSWNAVAKAFGVTPHAVTRWRSHLPELPITRQYIERWRDARKHRLDGILIEILRLHLAERLPLGYIAAKLNISFTKCTRLWKRAVKNYDNLRTEDMPHLTAKRARRSHRRMIQRQRSKHMKEMVRRRNFMKGEK